MMVKPDLKLAPILLGAIVCILSHFIIVGYFTPRVAVSLWVSILLISIFYLVGGFVAGFIAKYRCAMHGLIAAGAACLLMSIILNATGYATGYIETGVVATIISILIWVAIESSVGALGGTLGLLYISRKHLKRHYLRTLIVRIVVIGIFAVICLALLMTLCSPPF